jgi:hypothetical protein
MRKAKRLTFGDFYKYVAQQLERAENCDNTLRYAKAFLEKHNMTGVFEMLPQYSARCDCEALFNMVDVVLENRLLGPLASPSQVASQLGLFRHCKIDGEGVQFHVPWKGTDAVAYPDASAAMEILAGESSEASPPHELLGNQGLKGSRGFPAGSRK